MSEIRPAEPAAAWPSKVVVTLRAGGAFFAVANVICVGMVVWAYMAIKFEPKTLSVTGSARKAIVSDRVTWSGTITAQDENLVKAYETIKASADKVNAFLLGQGVPASEITFSAVNTARRFHKDVIQPQAGSNAPPTILTTEKVEMYTLTQSVSISSADMKRVPEVSRSVTSLIKDGLQIDSCEPSYLYTKLSELKINMLADATKDATTRAEQIVNNANGHLGKLVEARMGVMQVNPRGVSATSAEGNNDTSSYEKEITAVVSVRFEVR